MTSVEHYRKEVVTVPTGALAPEVAETMAEKTVGCVVVVSDEGRPLGMLTDRDLTTRVIAANRESGTTPAGAVMSRPLVSVDPSMQLDQVLAVMSEHGVRRVPVMSEERLVGLVALDDILVELGRELRELGDVSRLEIQGSRRAQGLRRLRHEVERLSGRLLDRAETLGEQAQKAVSRQLESIRAALRKHLS